MESSYINTGHPDFISGHKAMALVSERMNANKPAPPTHDPKTGKLAPGTLNNGRDLDSDLKKEEGFFGSFWPGGKKPASSATRKGAAAMEAVRSGLQQERWVNILILRLCVNSLLRCFVRRELCRSEKRWRRR